MGSMWKKSVVIALVVALPLVGCPPTGPAGPGFQRMNFVDGFNEVCWKVGQWSFEGSVAGDLQVSDAGLINGQSNVTFDDGTLVQVSFANSVATFLAAGQTIVIDNDDDHSEMLVNNEPLAFPAATDSFIDELNAVGAMPSELSAPALVIATLGLLYSTPAWTINTSIARSFQVSGFWCKADCVVVVTPLVILMAAGCAALEAACQAGSITVTLGGATVPCLWVGAVCVGGVFAGTTVAYEAWVTNVWS